MLEDVVIVTDTLNVDGGTAKVSLGSALALAESGLRVTVFAASGEASPQLAACENVRIVCTNQGDVLASRNPIAGALRGIWNRRAYAAMRDLLATLDRDRTVVHVHCWTKSLSSSVIASIVRARFPVVLTLHEYFSACPTGCLYLHRDRKICTLTPMSAACIRTDCDSRSYAFKLYRVVRQVVQRTLGRMPQGIADFITVSEFSRRVLEPRLPAVRRMYAVDNPVDAVRGPRVAAERNQTFAFVGRLSPEKGGVLLAEAARIAGVRVVFIGDGPDRAEIERVNPDAVVTGWLDRAGVRAQLCEARVAVVPSLWYETLGLVVLEAAALGVPAIVSDGTAPRDLITHGETGLGFERGNAPALATRLRACVDDGLVERMSIAAYDGYWRSPPTMGRHVQRLLATYGEVLARLGSGTPQVRSA